jgi:hypothetical protein
MIALAQRRR